MKLLPLAVVFALVGCGPTWGRDDGPDEDPVEEAIALYGTASDACAAEARTAVVKSVSFDDVDSVCGGIDEGCTMWVGGVPHIWLLDDTSGWTLTHESLHVLSHCDNPKLQGDPNHTAAVWKRLDAARFP